MKDAMTKMAAEGSKLDGLRSDDGRSTPSSRPSRSAHESKQGDGDQNRQQLIPSGDFSAAGATPLQRRPAANPADRMRTRRVRTNDHDHEVLAITTDVLAGDVAIPMGFKENR
jgi:hypothetical protein